MRLWWVSERGQERVYGRAEWSALVRGVKRDVVRTFEDRRPVLVSAGNTPRGAATYAALWDLMIPAVFVHPKETEGQKEVIAESVGAMGEIGREGVRVFDWTDEVSVRGKCVTIGMTGGTTGEPKYVCQGPGQWMVNGRDLVKWHGYDQDTVHATALPLWHANAYGQSLVTMRMCDGTLVLFEKFDRDVVGNWVMEEECDTLALVPVLVRRLVDVVDGGVGVGYVISAAAKLKKKTLERWLEKTGVRIIQGYGLSECTNFSCLVPPWVSDGVYEEVMLDAQWPSMGTMLDSMESVVEDGVLKLKGPCVFLGYVGDGPFEQGRWLDTGDCVSTRVVDGREYYYHEGRRSEGLKRGGEMLAPVAIEEEMRRAGAKGDILVVGIRSESLGEEVGALVTEEVDEGVLERVPWARRPKRIVVLDRLPYDEKGKINRRELGERWFDAVD